MRALLLALLLALPVRLVAQTLTPVAILAQDVRDSLAARWDDADPYQNERAYCATYHAIRAPQQHMLLYVVDALYNIVQDSAQKASTNQHHIVYTCPVTEAVITIHIHPPSTCEEWSTGHQACYMGGPEAYECFPSDPDQNTLNERHEPFALIQCDRNAVVPHFPTLKPHSVLKPKRKR